MDPYFQKILDDVEEYGFHSVGVGAGEETPCFRYSIGFWETLNAPEVLICGLGLDLMHSMLWSVFDRVKAGDSFADGDLWPGILDGYDCAFRKVHPTQASEYALSALWYREYRTGNRDLDVYQLFWPGVVQRLLPWDPDCDMAVREAQPSLYLPRGAH